MGGWVDGCRKGNSWAALERGLHILFVDGCIPGLLIRLECLEEEKFWYTVLGFACVWRGGFFFVYTGSVMQGEKYTKSHSTITTELLLLFIY